MGKTIAEKILARASGQADAKAGDIISAKIDLAYVVEMGLTEVHDKIVKAGLPDGLPELANPDIIAVMLGDHQGCHAKPSDAAGYHRSRELAKRYGISKLYDINTGISHVALTEEGLARPGMLVCGKDSHSTTGGGVNALATPISALEAAWIFATGELWFRIPETIKIVCNGRLPEGVDAKDMFLYMIGKYSPSMGQYRSLEWKGPVIDRMGMDGRLTLSCQSIELGAKCAPFEPDQTCLDYVASTPRADEPYWPTSSDADARFEAVHEEDFSSLEPQVALPHGFEKIRPVSEVAGVKVDQCNLGSCANGRYDDIAVFARIVKGKKVKARTIFAPGSWSVYTRASKDGLLATLAEAGVMVQAPGCLPCSGRGACITNGEVAMASTTRNFKGRFGAPNSEIYLGSVATTAATALAGEITDPREFL